MLAQEVITGVDPHEEVILAVLAVLATTVAGLVYVVKAFGAARTAAEQSAQTNDAVNHREFGELRLFEVVKSIEAKQDEFDRKWGNLPAEMGNAVALAELLHDMSQRVDNIHAQLVEHVAWEMAVKYPKEGQP